MDFVLLVAIDLEHQCLTREPQDSQEGSQDGTRESSSAFQKMIKFLTLVHFAQTAVQKWLRKLFKHGTNKLPENKAH